MPQSRPVSGGISEHRVHTSGPAENAKPITNTSNIATASSRCACVAIPAAIKAPTTARPIAITTKPA